MTRVIKQTRRERKKDVSRAGIIAAAVKLFSLRGINSVTVDQIAAAADIGKGTVYNYFRTKEDIIVAFMADVERKVQRRLSRFTVLDEPVDVILTRFIQLQFRLKVRHHAFVRVFLAQMFLDTEAFRPYMVEMQNIVDPPLEALFRNMQQRAIIRADIPITDLVMIVKTMHLGLIALWAVEGPPFQNTERTLRQEMKIFVQGLEKK